MKTKITTQNDLFNRYIVDIIQYCSAIQLKYLTVPNTAVQLN